MSRYLELATKLLPLVWSVFLLFGGLNFLFYYASIDFMPELDVKASITALATSAAVGTLLFGYLCVLLIIPALAWRGLRQNKTLKSLWYNEDTKLLHWSAILWFVLPQVGFFVAVVLIFLEVTRYEKFPVLEWLNYSVILVLIITGVYCWKMLPHDRKREDKIGAMISLLSVTLCNIAGLAAIMYFATLTIGADQRYKTDQIMWILVTIGSIILCNTVLVTTTYESGQRFILVAIFIVLVPLFFNFPFGRTIPKSTMRWFKFGSIEHALLILDEVGCNISRSHGIPVEQRVPDPKTCVLPDVMILSRLGTPYYIQMGETPQKRLTIPSQNVLSWSVIESKKATPPESPQNP